MKCMYCKHSVYPGCDDDYVAECELVGKDHLVHEDEAKTCPFFDSKIESKVLGEQLYNTSIMAELGQGIYDAVHKKSKDDDSINWRNELITKGAAVDALKDNMLRLTLAEEQRCEGHVVWGEDVVFADVLEKALLVLPLAQPPRMKARWECKGEPYSGKNVEWVCSNCGYSVWAEFCNLKYCSNCGYYMRDDMGGR